MDNDWHRSSTSVASFEPEELFGTKLRALLQRRKNRDLFDLYHGLNLLGMDRDKIHDCFNHYLSLESNSISRAVAEQRMLEKLTRNLVEDVEPLLPVGIRFNEEDAVKAFELVWYELISHIKGDAWKSTEKVLDEIRTKRYPRLLIR